MQATTKQKLIEFNKKNNWGTDDDSLIETITDYGTKVWEGEHDRHRWYSLIPTVVKVTRYVYRSNSN